MPSPTRVHSIVAIGGILALTLVSACQPSSPAVDPVDASEAASEGARACHIVFDAGSSGTRLHVFEVQADGSWLDHEGPKAGALADPVREQRDKTWADADTVAAEIAGLLEQQRAEFDWTSSCTLESVSVFATAGMRLAEQVEPERATQMYAKTRTAIEAALAAAGVSVPSVDARTLTGFEEGLYAWLALPDADAGALGLAEMGGASAQIAFPCPGCAGAHSIRVGGETVEFFSYSFLGLGIDEAPKVVVEELERTCAYGAALDDASWTPATCEASMKLVSEQGVIDPLNYGPDGQGPAVALPVDQFKGQWRRSGVLKHWNPEHVETCCEQRGECHDERISCFRTLYMPQFLAGLGVPGDAPISETSWTLGAVICKQADCLATLAEPLPCRWRPDGACLQ